MALKGTKPEAIVKRLKCLLYAKPKTGKTTAAIQFPNAYLIDCEKGAENESYIQHMNKSNALYLSTSDYDEIYAEVLKLQTEKHDRKTLIIDPLTVVYNDLLDREARKLAADSKDPNASGTEFGRHKVFPDRLMKRLFTQVMRLDMNVIITSHAKTKWEKIGSELTDSGDTFDCYGKLDYLFDLVLELKKRGDHRFAVVKYSRMQEAGRFPEGEEFEWSYDALADRYGREAIEGEVKPVEFATEEQIEKIKHLLEQLNKQPEYIEKVLAKAQANTYAEVSKEYMQKWIDALIKEVTK